MLSAEKIQENWGTYLNIIKNRIGEERSKPIIDFHMEHEERFMMMPASSKDWFHSAFPGGYIDHVIRVANNALNLYSVWEDAGGDLSTYTEEELVFAALFHDLGKMDTYKINPKTGNPTAYGHEKESVEYVEKFRDWIESFEGTDVDEIKYLVKNHMKIKPSTWDQMRDKKKKPIEDNPDSDKLVAFTDKLDGGGTNLAEQIRKILKEGNYGK